MRLAFSLVGTDPRRTSGQCQGNEMKAQRGFTLIELMIVVAIIAILAAIAISQYQDYVIRTQASEGSSLADGAKTAVGEFYNNYGRFATGSNLSYGLATNVSIAGKYVQQVDINGGIIDVTYGSTSDVAVRLQGQHLQFSPITHEGSIEWKCNHSSTLGSKYVPAVCRN